MDSAGELAHMEKPKKDIARYLLEHGADVNYRPAYTSGKIDEPVLHSAVVNAT